MKVIKVTLVIHKVNMFSKYPVETKVAFLWGDSGLGSGIQDLSGSSCIKGTGESMVRRTMQLWC